jgi:hypothetical protein
MQVVEEFMAACARGETERLAEGFTFTAGGHVLDAAGFAALVRALRESGAPLVLEDVEGAESVTGGAVSVGPGRPVRATWTLKQGEVASFALAGVPAPLRAALGPPPAAAEAPGPLAFPQAPLVRVVRDD